MQIKLFFTIAILCVAPRVFAQQQFISQGKIEYERKTNQHAFMDESSAWDDIAKKNLPKFVTFYYDLTFKGNRTMFRTGRDPETKQAKYWGVFDSENTILTNLDSNTAVTQRTIYGDMYLVTDSLRHIAWRITPEIRKIAGFDCRKAVGRVMDSIVVIAFYTDEILTTGGPESFTGLPGMILGVALPHENITWFATKVNEVTVDPKVLTPPKKGKPTNSKDLHTILLKAMKDWGNYAQLYLKAFSL